LKLGGSTLYGTTYVGGAYNDGMVFSIATSGGTPTTLLSFDGANGQGPNNDMAFDGSTLYGVTEYGGAYGHGVVYSVPVNGTPTTLVSFNEVNGLTPWGGLTLSGSTLYGTTIWGGGSTTAGNIFSIPVTGGTPTTIFTFGNSGVQFPLGNLAISGSTIYGSTQFGAIYSVSTTGSSFRNLLTLNGPNGEWPFGVTLGGSTLYGMTYQGGDYSDGTVFGVSVDGSSSSTLLSFNGIDGAFPEYGSLTLSGSTLYGMTAMGGAYGNGTIFSINTDGSGFQKLFDFNGADGSVPEGDLVVDGSTLYGMTIVGGANNDGTVFALNLAPTPEPSTFALLAVGAVGVLAYSWRRRRRAAMTT